MTDASRRLIGRGSIYTLGSAAPMLAGVLVTPLLTRSVSVTEYGWISVSVVAMQWTLSVLALGLPIAITRHAFTESSGTDGARGIALVASTSVLVAACLLTLVGAAVVRVLDANVPLSLAMAVVAGGAGAGVAMAQAWALAEERSWFYVALAAGVTLVAPTVGLVCVGLFPARDSAAYFAGVLASNVVLFCLALARVAASGPVLVARSAITRALRVGLPMVPHQFATGSANGIAVLVAGAVLGQAAGGQAQVAVYLGTVALVLTSAVGYAWLPLLARMPSESRSQELADSATVVTWLAGLAGAGVATLSPWLLRLLVPPRYDVDAMVPVTAVACISAAFAAVYLAHQQLVVISGRTGRLALLSPVAMLVGVGVSWVAASSVGLVGAAAGLPVIYLLLWLLTRYLARRVSPTRWAERRVLLPILSSTTVCLVAAVLPTSGPGAYAVRGTLSVILAAGGLRLLVRLFRSPTVPRPSAGSIEVTP